MLSRLPLIRVALAACSLAVPARAAGESPAEALSSYEQAAPAEPEVPKPDPKAEAPKAEAPKPEAPKPLLKTPALPPLGAAGKSRVEKDTKQETDDFVPMPDRWRIGLPEWERYRAGLGAPFKRNRRLLNPYGQNVLKGDYPVIGQNTFLDLSLTSDTLFDVRRRPTPSQVSAAGPGRFRFFGRGQQLLLDQTFFLSAELFHGETAFKPKDWAFRFTPAFNINHLNGRETGLVDIDPRMDTSRVSPFLGIQELFYEHKLTDLSPQYDFLSARVGVQPFNSDFRGFLFADSNNGVRFFGNSKSNRNQFNLAYFRRLEKDTYSRLNRVFRDRNQDVFIANFFRQDLFRPGYTGQINLAYSGDHGDRWYNNNGVQVRPPLIGDARPHRVNAGYIGFNGDGHFGRINVSHSFYQVVGYDSRNPIAGRSTRINAQMAAAEVSYDRDWLRLKGSFFYASGDRKPRDRVAKGFDSIFDNPVFAGGGFSFWQSQAVPLTGTGVLLTDEGSLLPNLRSGKLEGQSNFVNPGLLLFNVGADAELTPKWRVSANANWLNFMRTQPLQLVLNQSRINRSIGIDYSLGFRYRPWLNENAVLNFGVSALVPGTGFKDIYQNKTLYSFFTKLTLQY